MAVATAGRPLFLRLETFQVVEEVAAVVGAAHELIGGHRVVSLTEGIPRDGRGVGRVGVGRGDGHLPLLAAKRARVLPQ